MTSQLFVYFFQEIHEAGLARQWASHPSVHATLAVASSEVRTVSFPLRLNSLVSLPQDYSELMNNVSSFTCPNFSSDPSTRVPTMCLICGEVMCSQSYCCQTSISGWKELVGACTGHTEICGGGIGKNQKWVSQYTFMENACLKASFSISLQV